MSSRCATLRIALARLLVLLALLLANASAHGAPRPVVAIVKSSSIPPFEQAASSIQQVLAQDPLQPEILTFDLEGQEANAGRVLAAVQRANPRVIVCIGSLATSAVLKDDSHTPVVFSMVLYPRQSGFVSGPTRGVTGASLDIPLDVQFAYLRRLLPGGRRLGVLYHASETGAVVEAARAQAPRHGFSLETKEVDGAGDAAAALADLMEHVDAVWTVADSHVLTPQTTSALILAALRRRIPLIGLSTAHVRTGALAAFTCDYADVGRQTAELAARVLRGEAATTIPMSSPTKVGLSLNLRTAEHLGLSISPDVKREAGEVVP